MPPPAALSSGGGWRGEEIHAPPLPGWGGGVSCLFFIVLFTTKHAVACHPKHF